MCVCVCKRGLNDPISLKESKIKVRRIFSLILVLLICLFSGYAELFFSGLFHIILLFMFGYSILYVILTLYRYIIVILGKRFPFLFKKKK